VIKKPQRLLCDVSKVLSRMKPSILDREKYKNIYHILCILEEDELVKFVELQNIAKKLEKNDQCQKRKNSRH
jgi:hypothetical protein